MSEETLKTKEDKQVETVKTEAVKIKKEKSKKVSLVRKTAKTVKPKANIKFVGKEIESPKQIRDGKNIIHLPKAEEQLKGFFHKNADDIIRQFPMLYKRPVDKNGK